MDNGNQYRDAFNSIKSELSRLLKKDDSIQVIHEGIYFREGFGYIQVLGNVYHDNNDQIVSKLLEIQYVSVVPGVDVGVKDIRVMNVSDFINRGYKYQFSLSNLVIKT